MGLSKGLLGSRVLGARRSVQYGLLEGCVQRGLWVQMLVRPSRKRGLCGIFPSPLKGMLDTPAGAEQPIQNCSKLGEFDCLIKTKHCDGLDRDDDTM